MSSASCIVRDQRGMMQDQERDKEKLFKMFEQVFDLEDPSISCEDCKDRLGEYVDTELDGDDQLYAEVREMEVAERRGELVEPPVEPSFDLSFLSSNWTERVLKWGRAWLQRGTARWERIQVLVLPTLGSSQEMAPALAGLMSDAEMSSDIAQRTIAPQDAHFELKLVVAPESERPDEGLCRLDVALTLHDRFGDFSGAHVTLAWGEDVQTGETDTLGKVSFSALPCDQLASMSLTVTLPE